ncbi:ATP-binding protein [Microseira wollei]|uniref:histidine kinase n=1 Tax=Microseira wollei NIES-4236 TaxID=2530354 RepID=A0AAV3XB44_9CYAN|nr:ATP-binding protein [Microseira wollei]GET40097.1 PAS/PAC sensor hybrid histidine kinase [Microseira wollei NIES-4236]
MMLTIKKLKKKSTQALVALIAAAYLGNYFSLSLFFGIDFLFGSIAVLLVLYLFGLSWGIPAVVIASWHTFILWNHPYAAIVLLCEAIFVGYFFQKKRKNILLLDGIYWLSIGMPLVWIFYAGFLNFETKQALLVVLKQSVNGIFNALVANLIIAHLPIEKWVGRPQLKRTISFRRSLLNLFVAFVFFPALILMVFDGNRVMLNTENRIQSELQSITADLDFELQSWYDQRLKALTELARIAGRNTPIDKLQQSTELLQRTFSSFSKLKVANPTGTVIAANPISNEAGESTLGLNIAIQPIFAKIKTSLIPQITDVYMGLNLKPNVEIGVPVIVDKQFRGLVHATLNLKEISQLLKSQVNNQELRIELIDKTGRIIASSQAESALSQSLERRPSGEIKQKNNGVYQWLPPKGKLPTMMRWKKSLYVQETNLGSNIPWKLIVAVPAAPYISYLENVYIIDLGITLSIAVLALVLARLLSRQLVSPLAKLASETTNLPHKIMEEKPIGWIDSYVSEIGSLVENFQSMSVALHQKFQEIKSANETLEERVKERTDKLVKANKKLRNEIIERKRVEADLKKERNFISAILDTTGALVIVLDAQGRIVRFNRACEELTQYEFAEVEGKYVWELLLIPEELERVQAVFQELKEGNRPNQHENYWVAKDGTRRLIAWSNTVLMNTDGSNQYVIGSGIDITQRQQAESALRKSEILRKQAEALEQANRIKDEFLAIVSHELRTPLNSILGWAKLLRSRKYDAPTTERALETIERNAKSQAQLIDDILDISRIVRGKVRLNMRPINLVPVIQSAINSVLPTAANKNIEIASVGAGLNSLSAESSDLSLNPPLRVFADAERLQQVVWNLLSNAVKFTPEGGRVEVKLEKLQMADCRLQIDNKNSTLNLQSQISNLQLNYAKITVTDTGKGISPEFLPYVFERFRQADSSTTRSYGGLGLGLAIVRHLVELHGGTVSADSPGEGQGATFTVMLPLLEETPANAGELQSSEAGENKQYSMPNAQLPMPLNGLHVLVVDDDGDTRDFLMAALQEGGARVTSATSVEEARASLQQYHPDVLISDIGMPSADGYELIHQVRTSPSPEIAKIPALALTAYAREEDSKKALDAGFGMHLPKPVEPAQLISVVAQLARRTA